MQTLTLCKRGRKKRKNNRRGRKLEKINEKAKRRG